LGSVDDGVSGEVVGVSRIDHAREDRLRQQIDRIIAGIAPPVFPNAYGVRFVPVRQPHADSDIRTYTALHVEFFDLYDPDLSSRGGSRKIFGGGAGPSSFGRQQRLSEITIEPIT